ncbi:hypothetical protein [Chryseobacterium profundimaris]|uniref:Gliding motility-associated C-terminal domain-containing protein n=1 Tax=Chryseobacterium profundimaris TaxID=1387275 RepID=A0ABY1NLX6_9FLAO|nr:hypothetical protein [Chryseobacterium profundimaris]SMP13267.1 hypothetical protein SAMN06264346_102556 [Chryseobacterium profundimaris]
MAIATCNISFNINYTSSVPITAATASYRIKGSSDPYEVYVITPVPASGSLVTLPEILESGEYELLVELTASGAVTTKADSFKIGDCRTSTCEIPEIKDVQVQESGQIVIDYIVNTTNLSTPEYQISTDPGFKNVIHFRVDFDYVPLENVFMDGGNIPENQTLYIRARKHCASPSGVSGWSNVFDFVSGTRIVKRAPYTFTEAFCVSGNFKDPTNSAELGTSICWDEGTLQKTINLTTPVPQVGAYIYLNDGITPAVPANLQSFETGGANIGFKDKGIKWVRFRNYNGNRIYDVEPSTGLITRVSATFNCNT